jgi:HSP90 family molecular chaperone
VIEDQENRERLSKLLRFYSSKCEGDNLVGLEEYVARMKEGQKGIYYMVRGEDTAVVWRQTLGGMQPSAVQSCRVRCVRGQSLNSLPPARC